MCGIAGFWDARAGRDAESIARGMAASLHHRGPDDSGVWLDDSGIGLAHARLSIIDLSAAGHQPMASPSGRYVVVFNGEIYNFAELRAELEAAGQRFHGHSDTEVLVAGMDVWGVPRTLERCHGMLALAAWDRAQRHLYLARDRMGKKPLYYGRSGGAFLFGSELKALRAHPSFDAAIDPGAVALYRRYNYVPTPLSIYRGIYKLPAGSWLRIEKPEGELPAPTLYWSLADAANPDRRLPDDTPADVMLDHLEKLLQKSVTERMVADVPVGALLSGGIDSSLVTALMTKASTRVRTFTIGFHEKEFNEADAAARIAKHLGTEHTEMYASPEDALELVPRMPAIYDEPFADSSQVPTLLVSQLTRQHVTVALCGDGGDELFAGYNRYRWAPSIWKRASMMPLAARRGAARFLQAVGVPIDNALRSVNDVIGGRYRFARAGDLLTKVGHVMNVENREHAYLQLVSNWGSHNLDGRSEPLTVHRDPSQWPALDNYTEWMMYLDTVSYLPDDLLVKVDRASMAVSLELRSPLLDTRVVEYAWSLPIGLRLRGSETKWPLRMLLARHVPRELFERPKMGFGIPLGEWLRGPLREWAEDLLDPARMEADGLLDAALVHRQWREHLSGKDWKYDLWNALMLQAWVAEQKNTSGAGPQLRVNVAGAA